MNLHTVNMDISSSPNTKTAAERESFTDLLEFDPVTAEHLLEHSQLTPTSLLPDDIKQLKCNSCPMKDLHHFRL